MSKVLPHFGQIISFAPNERGGWYVILAKGSKSTRFRADAELFAEPAALGTLVSFIPGEMPVTGKNLPKAVNIQVVSVPESKTRR